MDNLHLGENFDIKDYYIYNKMDPGNYYYMDNERVLWGCGRNNCGQLGDGTDIDRGTDEIIKIAENVIHVDMNGSYFAIYLTEKGEPYGMGANLNGIMGMDVPDGFDYFLNPQETITDGPVLLMQDVSYAGCGDRSIVALQNDESVWWWGEFRTTSSKTGENTQGISCSAPIKILEDAIYVTSGYFTAGAIKKDGSLWTWGNNTFEFCGIKSGKDFIDEPIKVLDDVRMVWFDSVQFNSTETNPFLMGSPFADCHYMNVTFVEKKDGSFAACGIGVEGENSITSTFPLYGDILRNGQMIGNQKYDPIEIIYAESFQPVRLAEKDTLPNLKLAKCE